MIYCPISFYGQSKYSAEQYIQLFHQLYGLPYAILRYSNVYGMRQNMLGEAGVVSIFINQALRNKRITVYGDGSQTRDFIFVKDVAKANIQAVAFSGSGAFNISTNHPVSLNELLVILQESFDQPLDITYTDSRVGDIKDSSLSFNKAREFLQWEPSTRFDIGLKETVSYYRT
ncbi:NAD-dependent epimerase/dehydratase family protein, partial [Leptospira santarosai]|nr:NAD-dependent epimerase/dehydratase family protein [Leptospira santarosai]